MDIKKVDEGCYSIPITNFDLNQLYLEEMKDFLEKVEGGQTKNDLDFDNALINTKWMLGMHSSIQNQNKWAAS